MTATPYEQISNVDLFSAEGHDRDCARAMWNQARLNEGHRSIASCHSLSTIQVEHLLRIGYTRGRQAERERITAILAEFDAQAGTAPRRRWWQIWKPGHVTVEVASRQG
jgi:hypothetical protein